MSYAGPARPKNIARSSPKRSSADTDSTTHAERNTAFIAGVVLGAAVGAGVALLLAPRSGRSTRRRLALRGRRLGQRGRNVWQDLADEFREMRHRRKDAAADVADAAAS